MGVISPTIRGAERRADVRLAKERLAVWLIAFVAIVYLALSGGGYDTIARSEVGVIVWWVVLIGALVGVLPRARLSAWAGRCAIAPGRDSSSGPGSASRGREARSSRCWRLGA